MDEARRPVPQRRAVRPGHLPAAPRLRQVRQRRPATTTHQRPVGPQLRPLDRQTSPTTPASPVQGMKPSGAVALIDRGWLETGLVIAHRAASVFAGFRFPPEVISVAVRWYLRYGLSYRDVEELLAERGVTADHVTAYRWVQRFTPELIEAARPGRHGPGDRWFVDETYVKVAGKWTYLYRAVDQYGQVIDVLLSGRRDLAAARRFFIRALRAGTRLGRGHHRPRRCLPAGARRAGPLGA